MSLECSVELDGLNHEMKSLNKITPVDSFNPQLYRQPALAEGRLEPEKYRNPTSPQESPSGYTPPPHRRSRYASGEGVTLNTLHKDTPNLDPPAIFSELPLPSLRRAGEHFPVFTFIRFYRIN